MLRVNEFGCFDDCFNFVGGYFITKGKILYSEIFFNHQPLMAYLSYLIQSLSNPSNIYDLVLKHRQFVFLFGLAWNILIILRYSYTGAGFILFYETTKFYLFGDRFLAEGIIVYPLVYMFGLIWNKLENKKIYSVEFILIAIITWFVLFMREPFMPLVLILYFIMLFGKNKLKIKLISVLIFSILSFVTLAYIPISEYIFNVFTINSGMFFNSININTGQFLKAFFYPIFIFLNGDWNIFRHYIIGINIVFISALIFLVFKYKALKLIFFILLILGFANLRATDPGNIYYEAFHMLPWYGLFIIITFLMIHKIGADKKSLGLIATISLFIVFFYTIFSPDFFIHDKINPHESFMTNYGNYLQTGEVIKKLSVPADSLFVDGFDELIYWQAGITSNYKYSWYTSLMPHVPKYAKERINMFSDNPPDFYYGSCPNDKNSFRQIPEKIKNEYVQMYSEKKPTCLYIKKAKLPQISSSQWQKAKDFLYELPSY